MMKLDLSLYLVTDRGLALARPLQTIVEKAVKGGVTVIQLREKDCSSREFLELAIGLKRLLKPKGIPLIINDRLDIALAADADGLHVGQSDLPWNTARHLLGRNKIIGLSVESLEQAVEANTADVDYIAVSPVFFTPTKTDTKMPFGIEGVHEVAAITRHPLVAIGGINHSNAQQVMAAGADGIAVVSAIVSAPDPEKATRELKNIIMRTKNEQG